MWWAVKTSKQMDRLIGVGGGARLATHKNRTWPAGLNIQFADWSEYPSITRLNSKSKNVSRSNLLIWHDSCLCQTLWHADRPPTGDTDELYHMRLISLPCNGRNDASQSNVNCERLACLCN